MQSKNKLLIIRFSSFGDIVQAMGVLPLLKEQLHAEVHWVTRQEFKGLLSLCPWIDRVWPLDRKGGLPGLLKLGLELRAQGFTHIYDAHHNLRSSLLNLILCPPWSQAQFVQRPKHRLERLQLFKMRQNPFPQPFRGMHSYLWPLKTWEISQAGIPHQVWNFNPELTVKLETYTSKIVLVPSAAWELKRWPLKHWQTLIQLMPEQEFVVLGGPEDDFCQTLEQLAPGRVRNLAGKLSLTESCYVVAQARLVISADTGLLHVADLLNVLTIALEGPTAFGHPTGQQVKTLEVDLPCRPCTKDGRGQCSQDIYQRCMVEITPAWVAHTAKAML